MLGFATDLINGAALWKIIVASFVGGAGVAIAFGVLLLGLHQARKGGSDRFVGYGIATACATFCVAAVVVGVIAMADKPASKPPKQPPANIKPGA
jgi:NADH:ubiquinone oxidoreductase subunit 6 (subunit J)